MHMIRRVAALAGAFGMVVAGSSTVLAAAPTVHDVSGTSGLVGVACETSSICVAVGDGSPDTDYGAVVTITKGAAGTAQEVSTTGNLIGDACWSSKRCIAIGQPASGSEGVALPITSGTPGSPVAVTGSSNLYGVACLPRPSTTCYAVGQNSTQSQGLLVPIVNGVVGASASVTGTTDLDAIVCPAATTCYASGRSTSGDGVIVTISGGTPGAQSSTSVATELFGIACTSATLCYAVGSEAGSSGNSEVVTVSGGTTGTAHASTGVSLDHVACVVGGKCLVSGYIPSPMEGVESTVTSGSPGAAVKLVGTQDLFLGACATAKACEVPGETSNYTVGLFAASAV
jgi:hypothetical protein